jgi:hypothetical protein
MITRLLRQHWTFDRCILLHKVCFGGWWWWCCRLTSFSMMYLSSALYVTTLWYSVSETPWLLYQSMKDENHSTSDMASCVMSCIHPHLESLPLCETNIAAESIRGMMPVGTDHLVRASVKGFLKKSRSRAVFEAARTDRHTTRRSSDGRTDIDLPCHKVTRWFSERPFSWNSPGN